MELEPALRPLAIAEEFTALNSKETHDVDLPVYFPPMIIIRDLDFKDKGPELFFVNFKLGNSLS